jgi:methyltransferase-like protein/SAM-dependent methyltransferase
VVGIDLSEVQVGHGRARVQALGLDNVDLLAGDVARMDLASLGDFDFVIAHGVYSWVPPEVQDALLSAFHTLLAPDGIAYLSYNTYPGWKAKEIIRDAMLLASGTSTTPDEKAREARRMADFLGEVAPADSVLGRALADSASHALGFGDSYLLHDELETFNAPCYFYEMLQRAGAHGLTYLAEAHPEHMIPGNFGPKVAEYLAEKAGGVQVLAEQYLDFALNRMFRQSLLIHAAQAPQVRYHPDRSRFGRLHVAAWLPPVEGPTVLDNSRQEYRQADGATLFTNDPGIKAALDALSDHWPATRTRQDILDDVRARLVAAQLTPSDSLGDHVDDLIGLLILQGSARIRLDPVMPGADPLRLDERVTLMAALTRAEADASTFNLWHETLILSAADRHLLPLLDGTRDRNALVEALLAVARDEPILEDQPTAETALRAAVAELVDTLPERLVDMELIRRP